MAKELSQGTPCGDTVTADSQAGLGAAFSQHQNGCSECQQILEALRQEVYGPRTTDPRDA